MTNKEANWCNQLTAACALRTEQDCSRYSEAIAHLRDSRSLDVLRHMLRCFRDTEAGEIQYELLEACEAFPDDVYVMTFVDLAPQIKLAAPDWFGLAFQAILNTPACLEIAINIICSSNDERQNFWRITIQSLSIHTPKYADVLKKLKW